MTRTCFLKTMTEKLDWYDIGLTKWAAMFFLLFVLTVWPAAQAFLLSIAWYWYLALSLIISVPIIVKMLSPAKTRAPPTKKQASPQKPRKR